MIWRKHLLEPRSSPGYCLTVGFGLAALGNAAWSMGQVPPLEWLQTADGLVTTCQFANFVEAVDFVNRLVEPAERLGHHPDLAVAYNQLTIRLTTHDAGGITDLDFALAREISALQTGQCQRP
ncbi:MAG: 4a-hydroxytetrahydrobiopterin dehydratase [Nodosilinea sp.]